MIRMIDFVVGAVILVGVAQAEENATAQLLGPAEGWGECNLELHDVHGLWGGDDVFLDGRGGCYVQRVDPSQQAQRFRLEIPPEEAQRLFRLAIEQDLVGLEIPERAGVPDEGRPALVLRGQGGTHELAKWANDEVARFDAVQTALRALIERAEQGDPYERVPYDRAWHPTLGAEVTLLAFSGRPDPRWNLEADALQPLLDKLAELPEAEPVVRPGLGYRGYRIRFRGGVGPGANVEVFRGTVLIQQRDGSSTTHQDAHGLEAWLDEQATQRGIERPR